MRRQSARGGEGLEGGGAEGRGQREGGPFGGRPGPSLRGGRVTRQSGPAGTYLHHLLISYALSQWLGRAFR